MSRVVRTLIISNKSWTNALIGVRHPAVDRNAVCVSLRANNLLVTVLRLMRIYPRTSPIRLDDFRELLLAGKGNCLFSPAVPATVHFILPFFISKTRLLSDIRSISDSLGLTRICIDNLRRAVFLAAALPTLEVVWVVRSKKDLRDLVSLHERSEKLRVFVEVHERLLDSKYLLSTLLECSTHVIATKVKTPERALELRTWSISEIASQHITVLNIL
ncbi:MAG: hypothetical protein VYD09_02815 [Chloroflexota bacterium]|nr:hypothetical protein [Chloroflexota bacterium]